MRINVTRLAEINAPGCIHDNASPPGVLML
jgi:hypothetical protein